MPSSPVHRLAAATANCADLGIVVAFPNADRENSVLMLCDRDGILSTAKNNGADKDVLDALEAIPDRTYDGPNAVSQAVS
jgi:hypothetical protein